MSRVSFISIVKVTASQDIGWELAGCLLMSLFYKIPDLIKDVHSPVTACWLGEWNTSSMMKSLSRETIIEERQNIIVEIDGKTQRLLLAFASFRILSRLWLTRESWSYERRQLRGVFLFLYSLFYKIPDLIKDVHSPVTACWLGEWTYLFQFPS